MTRRRSTKSASRRVSKQNLSVETVPQGLIPVNRRVIALPPTYKTPPVSVSPHLSSVFPPHSPSSLSSVVFSGPYRGGGAPDSQVVSRSTLVLPNESFCLQLCHQILDRIPQDSSSPSLLNRPETVDTERVVRLPTS